MRLHLIRHGETTSNADGRLQGHLDEPLNDRGVREAELLAERLAGMRIAVLYTSPLIRARSTAETVSTRLGLDLRERDFLMERDLGELSGLTGDEIGEKYPGWRERRYLTNAGDAVPGYERDEEFNERVIPNLEALISDHPKEEIAVVTHGGVIAAFCRHFMGITVRGSVQLSNASICTYEVRDGLEHGQMLSLNDTCHLDA